MQGRCQTSIDLSNVRADIKRATTRGKVPRPYTQEEMAQLQEKERAIVAKQTQEKTARRELGVFKGQIRTGLTADGRKMNEVEIEALE